MTREEIKNIVRHVFHFYEVNSEDCNWTDMNEACGEILKALEQEPKTVLYSGDGYADGYMVYDMVECPNCGYEYEEGDKDWKEPFCPHCGQALKWESEAEE